MRSSITWLDLHPKKLPKNIKKSPNPAFEVTSHLMFAAKVFKTWKCTNQIKVINLPPFLQMELACSVKCGTRKRILDSSGGGPRWKAQVSSSSRTKCKPVLSGSKLSFSQEEIYCSCFKLLFKNLRDSPPVPVQRNFFQFDRTSDLVLASVGWVRGSKESCSSSSCFLLFDFALPKLFVFCNEPFYWPINTQKTKTLKPPRHRSLCWKMESLHPWSMPYPCKAENFG